MLGDSEYTTCLLLIFLIFLYFVFFFFFQAEDGIRDIGVTGVQTCALPISLYLFAIVFFWTPPHFWALSLLMKDEYAKVGVPMLPVVRGEAETRRQIVLYTGLLLAVTLLPVTGDLFGALYLAGALALGAAFTGLAVALLRRADRRSALRLYLFSLAYLALLFAVMVADARV